MHFSKNIFLLSSGLAFGVFVLLGMGWLFLPMFITDGVTLADTQQIRILLQVFIMFFALIGLLVKLHKRHITTALLVLMLLIFWQVFELIPRSLIIFAPDTAVFDDAVLAMSRLRNFLWVMLHLVLGLTLIKKNIPLLGRILGGIELIITVRSFFSILSWMYGFEFGFLTGTPSFFIVMMTFFFILGLWLYREPHVLDLIKDKKQ